MYEFLWKEEGQWIKSWLFKQALVKDGHSCSDKWPLVAVLPGYWDFLSAARWQLLKRRVERVGGVIVDLDCYPGGSPSKQVLKLKSFTPSNLPGLIRNLRYGLFFCLPERCPQHKVILYVQTLSARDL